MSDKGDVRSNRARRLRVKRDRISAEIVGVENGGGRAYAYRLASDLTAIPPEGRPCP